jgi:hypothetical protein
LKVILLDFVSLQQLSELVLSVQRALLMNFQPSIPKELIIEQNQLHYDFPHY